MYWCPLPSEAHAGADHQPSDRGAQWPPSVAYTTCACRQCRVQQAPFCMPRVIPVPPFEVFGVHDIVPCRQYFPAALYQLSYRLLTNNDRHSGRTTFYPHSWP